MPSQKIFATPQDAEAAFYEALERCDLDAMMEAIYDWQYAWQWDLVGQRYFARSLLTTPWYMDVHNLQENWAGRLADLDLTTAERARSLGFGMLWDDAGS